MAVKVPANIKESRWLPSGWYKTKVFDMDTTVFLGYRALSQDYEKGDFAWDVTAHGPILGAEIRF